MESALFPLLIAVLMLLALGLSAIRWGHDSRQSSKGDRAWW